MLSPLVTKGGAKAEGSNVDMTTPRHTRVGQRASWQTSRITLPATPPGSNHPIAGVTAIQNDIWYHAAATYDGAKWQLFLNGVQEGPDLVVNRTPRSDSIQHAAIASALNSTGVAAGFFNGVMDEVRIWNFARTAQQISQNMGVEITPTRA